MRKNKLTYTLLLTAGVSMLMFSGCNKKPAETSAAATEAATEAPTEAPAETLPELQYDLVKDTAWAETAGNGIVKSGANVMVNYGDAIWQFDTNAGKLTKLIEGVPVYDNNYWVYAGSVYYVKRNNELLELWRYNMEDASEKFEAEISISPMNIYVDEKQVFIKGYDSNQVFRLNADGDTEGELPVGECVIGLIPEGLSEIYTVNTAYAATHYKYLPLTDGNCLVITDVNGENPRKVEEITNTSSVLFAEKYFFCPMNDGSGNIEVWKYDVETLDKLCVFRTNGDISLIQSRNGYLYYRETKMEGINVSEYDFYSVSDGREYEKGSESLVSSVKNEAGMLQHLEKGIDFFVAEDAIYTEQFKDYGVFFAKYVFGKSDEPEIIEPELVPSYLTGIGEVKADSKKFSDKSGTVYGTYYMETLVLDEKDDEPGIKAINETMKAVTKNLEKNTEEMLYGLESEEISFYKERPYSFTYTYNDIEFINKELICIRMDGYEYSGGAHGLPLRDYYIFNLKTGAELKMSDIIETPESELQQIVSAAFKEKAEKENFAFEAPEDLAHTVAEMTDYNLDFYITEEGMVFFFPPYLIAPFSEGFPEVVIPYSELKLKVKLP